MFIILCFVALVFAALGITDLIFLIRLLLSRPSERFYGYSVIVLEKEIFTGQLNSVLQKKHWYGRAYADAVIAVTKNLSECEKDYCKNTYRSEKIIFCDSLTLF